MSFQSGFDTPKRSRSGRRSSRRQHRSHSSKPHSLRSTPAETTVLKRVFDGILFVGFAAVVLAFGGRTPIGQFLLLLTTVGILAVWGIDRLTTRAKNSYRWTGFEVLLIAVISYGLFQTTPLDSTTLESLSPYIPYLLGQDLATISDSGAWSTVSLTPHVSIQTLIPIVCVFVILLLVCQRFQDTEHARKTLVGVSVGVSCFALFGILQLLLGNGKFFGVIEHPHTHTLSVAKGSFTNANHFAGMLALALGPALTWTLCRSSKQSQQGWNHSQTTELRMFLGLGVVALLILGIVLTGSRGGLLLAGIGIGTSLILVLFFRLADSRLPLMLTAVGLIGLGLISMFGEQMLERNVHDLVSSDLEELDQGSARSFIWSSNLAAQSKFPWFGTGLGSHRNVISAFHNDSTHGMLYTHAESSYLQIGTEAGIVGWIMLGVAILFVLGYLIRAYLKVEDNQQKGMLIGTTASLMVFLVHGVYDFAWYNPAYMLFVAMIVGYVISVARRHSSPQKTPQLRMISGGIAGTVAIALACFTGPILWNAAQAEPVEMEYLQLTSRGKQFETVEDELSFIKLRVNLLKQVVQLCPHDIDAHIRIASNLRRVFELQEQNRTDTMPLSQIRAAVYMGGFEDSEKTQTWLANDAVMGKSLPLVKTCLYHSQRALKACPTRSEPLLMLSDYSFIMTPNREVSEELLTRCERIHPYAPEIPFTRGYVAWNDGDIPVALEQWQKVFNEDDNSRSSIIKLLTPSFPVDQLVTLIEPEDKHFLDLVKGYQSYQPAEYPNAAALYANLTIKNIKQLPHSAQEKTISSAFSHLVASENIETTPHFIQAATPYVEYSADLRKLFGRWLVQHEEFTAARPHLEFCAQRAPNDQQIQDWLRTVERGEMILRTKGLATGGVRILR